jgi:N-acetylneuraminic acid mutarotase
VARLREHWRFLAIAVAALAVTGILVGLLTDTPAEIRVRQQLGLDHPCLPETEDSPGWREEASLPSGTDEARAVEVDGRIYVAGGTSRIISYGRPSSIPGVREEVRAESLSRVLAFDPAAGTYEARAPMPERLNHQGMGVHDGRIYVAGGSGDLLFGADARRELFEYDPAADTWTELAGMPTPRLAPGAGVIDDRLYIAGGMSDNGRLMNTLEAYDFDTGEWERLASMPTAREHVASTVLDGKLYVLGGRTLETDSLDVVERYDPETDTWETLAPLPQDAGSFEAAAVNGRVLTVGGDDDREGWVTGAVQSYDPATDTWSQLPEMRTMRHGHAVAVAADRLYAFGGSPCALFAASDIVESFDTGLVR